MLSPLIALAAVSAAPLQPSGPWNVETSEKMCLLSRPFGTGDDQVLVGFQPLFAIQSMELMVVGKHAAAGQVTGPATVLRQPFGDKLKGTYYSVKLPDGRYLTKLSAPASLFDQLGETTSLAISAGSLKVPLAVVRFSVAKPVFDQCQNDLLKSWGVDPAMLDKQRSPKPLRPVANYFSPDTYPSVARSNGYIGRAAAVLQVDAAGAVSDCRIVISAGKALDEVTCSRARKIPFAPGHASDGKTAASIYVIAVRWAM